MHMLGFEGAMIFFAAITGTIGIYLRSNALDKLQDPKLVPIDLKVFKTDRIFDFGAFGVIAILTILYIALW
jgi:SSS family solute:Na+ symporter